MDEYTQLGLACQAQMYTDWPAPFQLQQENGRALWAMNPHGSTFFIEELAHDQGNLQAGDYLVRWMSSSLRQLRPPVPSRPIRSYGTPGPNLVQALQNARPLPISWAWGVADRRKTLELLIIQPQSIDSINQQVRIFPLVGRERAANSYLRNFATVGELDLGLFWQAIREGNLVSFNELFAGQSVLMGQLPSKYPGAHFNGFMYAPQEAWYKDEVRVQNLRQRQTMTF